MTNEFFTDPRVRERVSPEVLAYLETNHPPEDAPLDHQVGHWIAVAATVLTALAEARQRVRELEADA